MDQTFLYDLAAVDLDNTLLGPDKRISSANRAAVHALRACGVEVVLASGRATGSMIQIHRELQLDGCMISLNGAVISRPSTGETIRSQRISPEVGSHLIAEGAAHGFTLVACCPRRSFASAQTHLLERYQARGGEQDAIIGFPSDLGGEDLLKLIWIAEPALLDAVQLQVMIRDSGRLNIIRSDSLYLEFMAADADKEFGLRAVAEMLQIPRKRTMAFGDGANDIKMLAWAGLGVAVGHAIESVKAAVDFVGPKTEDPSTAFAAAVTAILPAYNGKTV